jgi:shikimate kinase/3-dehydroquinate synthase
MDKPENYSQAPEIGQGGGEAPKLNSLVFLYGPPGSGKSVVGRALAGNLGLTFFDLDEEIESFYNTTIPQIFNSEGEAGFRQKERERLGHLQAVGSGVIALGGGALTDPDNRKLVESAGRVLCLTAPLETLYARLSSDAIQRPLLVGDPWSRLQELVSRRSAHYASFPDSLNTAESAPDEIAWECQVRLGMFRVSGMGQAYDVRVVSGGLDALGKGLVSRDLRGPIALVSDENVGPIYAARVEGSLKKQEFSTRIVLIPAGEAHKTVETVANLWDGFLAAGLERGSTVVALGGGVVGDLAGFAAATYLRGIPWVVLPTSLLAMADSSLGGKTGADLPQGKNLVGAFHAPRLVLADPLSLSTLPLVELRSGLAEVVKAGIIADPRLFELCEGLDDLTSLPALDEIVRRSMAVKVRVIQSDPFEKGLRASLNLGHTIGHGVELASNFQLRHGEAVAIGMVAEARLAERMSLAGSGLSDVIAGVLARLGLPTRIPSDLDRQLIQNAMRVDKKKARGSLRFALPIKIGEVKVGVEVADWGLVDWAMS